VQSSTGTLTQATVTTGNFVVTFVATTQWDGYVSQLDTGRLVLSGTAGYSGTIVLTGGVQPPALTVEAGVHVLGTVSATATTVGIALDGSFLDGFIGGSATVTIAGTGTITGTVQLTGSPAVLTLRGVVLEGTPWDLSDMALTIGGGAVVRPSFATSMLVVESNATIGCLTVGTMTVRSGAFAQVNCAPSVSVARLVLEEGTGLVCRQITVSTACNMRVGDRPGAGLLLERCALSSSSSSTQWSVNVTGNTGGQITLALAGAIQSASGMTVLYPANGDGTGRPLSIVNPDHSSGRVVFSGSSAFTFANAALAGPVYIRACYSGPTTGVTSLQRPDICNTCLSSPCQQGGTCTDGIDSFSCNCVSGYTGAMCQTQLACLSSPCLQV
jgi:hypothetical protein